MGLLSVLTNFIPLPFGRGKGWVFAVVKRDVSEQVTIKKGNHLDPFLYYLIICLLYHGLLTILDDDSLGGVGHLLTIQVVDVVVISILYIYAVDACNI